MRLTGQDLRSMGLLKYYRLVRRWACKTYDLKDGVYTYSWDKNRWERLRRNGWIDVFKERNRTTSKYAVYKVSMKGQQLIMRIYRILLGEEDMPTSRNSVFYKNKTYTDKVYNKAIDDMINDKER
jgi:hypothetical protein